MEVKYCNVCGALLNEQTGECPNCNVRFIPSAEEIPRDSVKEEIYKSVEELTPHAEKKHIRKEHKKAERANWSTGKKIRHLLLKVVAICLTLAIVFGSAICALVFCGVLANPFDKGSDDTSFFVISGKFTGIKITNEKSAIRAAQDAASKLGLKNATDELSLKNYNKVDNLNYYRLQENYMGIPVYGKTIVIVADNNGIAKSLTSNLVDISGKTKVSQTLNDENIKKAIASYTETNSKDIEIINTEKVFYVTSSSPKLCHRVTAELVEKGQIITIIISIKDIEVLYTEVSVDPATICYDSTSKLQMPGYYDGKGKYKLLDEDKHFYCFTANGKPTYSYGKETFNKKSAKVITSRKQNFAPKYDDVFVDREILEDVALYYSENFFDKGPKYFALVVDSSTGTVGGLVEPILAKELMEIQGDIEEIGAVFIGSNENSPVPTFTLAHEYTHTITQHQIHWQEKGFKYADETGAINEAYSDIFGMIINQKINPDDNIWTSGRTDVSNPAKYNYPLKVNSEKTWIGTGEIGASLAKESFETLFLEKKVVDKETMEKSDVAYRYAYAVTLEHAFYLMNQGIQSNTGISIDVLAQLWYHTMLTLPPACNFASLRQCMEAKAVDLDFTQEQIACISAAFDEIGIGYDGTRHLNITVTASDIQDQTADYSAVINQYSKAIQNNYYANIMGAGGDYFDKGEYLNGELLLAAQYDDPELGKLRTYYALFDINNDGIEECIIGAGYNPGIKKKTFTEQLFSRTGIINYDIFTFENGKPKPLFEFEYGYRSQFGILKNGAIATYGASGAESNCWKFYKLPINQTTLLMSECVGYEFGNYYRCVNNTQKDITENEFDAIVDRYDSIGLADLNWIEIKASGKIVGSDVLNNAAKGKTNLTDVKVNSIITFGSYEQDNNTSNGKEPIEWQVLDKKGNKILIISKYVLDYKPYSDSGNITWAGCTVRKWLNGAFIQNSFSPTEQDRIQETGIQSDISSNAKYVSNSGKVTKDKVFLLSLQEANDYFDSDVTRRCTPTDYAAAQGVYTDEDYVIDGKSACGWYLRSLGDDQVGSGVFASGRVLSFGSGVDPDFFAPRPAMWITVE